MLATRPRLRTAQAARTAPPGPFYLLAPSPTPLQQRRAAAARLAAEAPPGPEASPTPRPATLGATAPAPTTTPVPVTPTAPKAFDPYDDTILPTELRRFVGVATLALIITLGLCFVAASWITSRCRLKHGGPLGVAEGPLTLLAESLRNNLAPAND